MALSNTGIFQKAQDAKIKTGDAETNQKAVLDEYEKELSKYGKDSTIAEAFDETGEIAGKVHIGDYVKYTLDSTNTDGILEELNTYSGTTKNSTETLAQEKLDWRVLDIKNGQVRLISATPTTSKIVLFADKGYNNAVYLIDKTCETLYNNTQLASKVQNLKIEDIQEHLEYDYTQYENSKVDTGKYGGTKTFTDKRYYPNLFAKEKMGWVDEVQGTELDLSEQTEPLNEKVTRAGKSIKITQTCWEKTMEENDFTKSKYYELFINNGSNYSTYWISSRCTGVDPYFDYADFNVYTVNGGKIKGKYLYDSDAGGSSAECVLRPCITLKSNVQIDISSGDGKTSDTAYVIK